MKHLKLATCLIIIACTLSACSGGEDKKQSLETTTIAETTTVADTTEAETSIPETTETVTEEEISSEANANVIVDSSNILTSTKVKTAEVMNGTMTESIGSRAYIEVSKDDLRDVTEEQYADFVDTIVKDSGYNWFTIICDDGTGITFTGSMGIIADYGKIDDEGRVTEIIGTILLKDGNYIYDVS